MEYDAIVKDFQAWLAQKSLLWVEQQNTSLHLNRKLWSIYHSEMTGYHNYNNYRVYRKQIMSVIQKQLYVWKRSNMNAINERRQAKCMRTEFFIKI